MPPDYNKVILIGRLTRDVELRKAGAGASVGNFGLAIGRKFKAQSGEQREETTFVDCEVWGKTADVMAQYLGKGKPVFVEGRLKLDQWEGKDGAKQSKLRVVVENFQFIDTKGSDGGGGGGGARGGRASGGYDADDYPHIDGSDIPF